jgi:hypothetical protein
MILSPEYNDPLTRLDGRFMWEDFSAHDFPTTNLHLSDLKQAFPKFINPEIDTALDSCPLLAGPSISLESLVGALPEDHSGMELTMEFLDQAPTLEFDGAGNLIIPEVPTFFGADCLVGWENDLFAGALSITELPEVSATPVSPTQVPVSPTFTSSIEVESPSASTVTPAKKSPKSSKHSTPSRKRSSPAGPSEETPKSLMRDSTSPKRQRRHSGSRKPSVTFALEPQILSFSVDREERTSSKSKQRTRIGLLSSSTHQLSQSVIRNIFRSEEVVTLVKEIDEDDEDVDIL